MLATHEHAGGQTRLGHMPRNRDATPMWGRIRIVRDEVATGRALTLAEVTRLARGARHRTEAYAWCWAAAAFLDAHPRYRQRFRSLIPHVMAHDFDRNAQLGLIAQIRKRVQQAEADIIALKPSPHWSGPVATPEKRGLSGRNCGSLRKPTSLRWTG